MSSFILVTSNWAATSGNVPSDMCAQKRLKPACASAQADKSHRCPHKKKLCITAIQKCAQWRFWSDCANAKLIWILTGRTCPEVRFLTSRFNIRQDHHIARSRCWSVGRKGTYSTFCIGSLSLQRFQSFLHFFKLYRRTTQIHVQ